MSVSDDDTFFTARSHEQSTVHMDNTHELASTARQVSPASIPRPLQDETESILTVEPDRNAVVPQPPAVKQELAMVPAAARPFIPRAMQVDKVLLHLQLHVSDLVRPRTVALKSFLFGEKTVNPYFEVELLHQQSDVALSLHKSQPYYHRREALWEPVRFAIDATIAKARGMVLSINMYHKQTKNGKSKDDEWIGGHQASPWDLNESVDQIPLKRDQISTGKVRLVSYQMVPLDRADCWRVYL